MRRDEIEREQAEYETYDPHHLLDSVLDCLKLADDEALAVVLAVPVELIEDVRQLRRPIDAAFLIRLHELTGITLAGLRNILGDRRKLTRMEDNAE